MASSVGDFEVKHWYPPETAPNFKEYEGDISEATEGGMNKSGGRLRKLCLLAIIGLAVVGIIVGVAVGVSSGKETVASPAMTPTMFKDDTPGPTPTTANLVMDTIYAVARNNGTEFEDAESYQSKALAWVMTQALPAPQYPNLSMEDQALQLYALACIYFSTFSVHNAWTDFHFGDGASIPVWFNNQGWLEQAGEVCDWHGITCNSDNKVAKIELDANGLTGSFPPEVVYLKNTLTYLDLYNNLVHNKGDEGNTFLGELTNLENLYFGTTSFEYDGVPTVLGKLTKLKELDFSYSLYFGALPEGMWGGMTDLSYLVMDGNAYNSSFPQDLVSLPSLEYLYAGFTFLEGDLNFISQMPKIFELWIDNNPGIVGSIPSSIATAETLASLSITSCGLTGTIPTEIGLLTDMIQMWFFSNKLSGSLPTELGSMVKLKILNVEANDLTGAMPDDLCSKKSPFGRLEELEADCDGEITCADTCCTCCGEQCIES